MVDDRCVVDQRGRRVAAIQRRAVKERLEAGAGLAAGLHHAVVVALLEGEAAHQGEDGAVLRIQRNQRALRGGQLTEGQAAVRLALHADQVAGLHHVAGLLRPVTDVVGVQVGAGPLHGFPAHRLLALAGQHQDAVFFQLADDGRLQAAEAALLGQLLLPGFAGLAAIAGFRATVTVTLVVALQAQVYGAVGEALQVAGHGGVDVEAFRVGLAAVQADHFRADHLRHVGGVQFRSRNVQAYLDRLGQRVQVALLVDLAEAIHAPEDPVAALLAALRVGHRVVARGRLGQAGDHRQLGQAQLLDGFSVIDLRGGLDAVGAVAQIDLVHVQLEDLVLAQVAFDLQGQQDFRDLAREALFAGQEVVLRHLHGDGAAAGLDLARFQ